MSKIRIEAMDGEPVASRTIEIVERKGIGHPDTICDMLSERLSVALSRHYQERFGLVLHHNVDKALLTAGHAEAAFGGGEVIEPIDIYLSGRATTDVKGEAVPVEELAWENARAWFSEHFHALDSDRHVRVRCLVRPGSKELVDVFLRQREEGVVLCNDTSCGVGFAPLTGLERTVLEVERHLNSKEVKTALPAAGEDIKVMGVREHDRISLTVSCALIGRFLENLPAYAAAKDQLAALVSEKADVPTGVAADVLVNAADDLEREAIYLTVTGTSAESGDDGETGRGNRANGLITPLRPMTLEAVAGKNPVSHVGKLYNVAAQLMAEALVSQIGEVREVESYLVSQIGAPIDQPKNALVRIRTVDGAIAPDTQRQIEEIADRHVAGIGRLWKGFLDAKYTIA